MTTHTDPFAAIAARLGGQLRRHWTLTGGVSAQVEALELTASDGVVDTVVVRRRDATGQTPREEDATATEYRLLRALFDAGLPVPRPRLLDVSCELLGGPFLVMDHVVGTTEVSQDALSDALDAMAAFLARLHAVDVAGLALPELPRRDDPAPELLVYLPRLDALATLRARLEAWRTRPAPMTRALLHGDYWPGNVLWRDGALAAVIDWEDAAIGDPLADLAGARVELLWRHGATVVEQFTTRYKHHSGRDVDDARLALWDAHVASAGLAYMGRWGLDPAIEATMRARTLALLPDAARRVLGG